MCSSKTFQSLTYSLLHSIHGSLGTFLLNRCKSLLRENFRYPCFVKDYNTQLYIFDRKHLGKNDFFLVIVVFIERN